MNTPSDPPVNDVPSPPESELEYGEEVLSAGWNPDIERLAKAKAREDQVEGSGQGRKRR